MNSIKSFIVFAMSAAVALTIASCSDYDFMSEEEIKLDQTLNEYTSNFEARYGKIDPNHTWGLSAVNVTGAMATRTNVPNKNQWYDPQYNNLQVPGCPDIWYDNSGNEYNNGFHSSNNTYQDTNPGGEQGGDVTDEEIQYVSWYFRTHKFSQSEEIHCTDFFIQEISSDNDRDASGNIIKNIPINNYDESGNLTGTQNEDVIFKIDALEVLTFEATAGIMPLSGDGNNELLSGKEGYDHIYNFNAGLSNSFYKNENLPMDISQLWSSTLEEENTLRKYKSKTLSESGSVGTNIRNIGYYTSSGTEDFMVHYSNDGKWRNENDQIWTLQHLTFVGPSGRVYDGWYLGFDYAFEKKEFYEDGTTIKKSQVRERDHYYSNWIVKITPAVSSERPPHEGFPFTRRVMCEDLGNTCDFDFNDVVFDVTYYHVGQNTYDVKVDIQAAGGTMPIYVGVEPNSSNSKYEAHGLLGYDSYTPVNVGGASHASANYHLTVSSTNPDDIPIYVINNGETLLVPRNDSQHKGNLNNYNNGQVGTAKAPMKFGVPTTVRWMAESQQIESAYEHFADWVRNEHGAYREINNDDQKTVSGWNYAWFDNRNIKNPGKLVNVSSGFESTETNTPVVEEGGDDPYSTEYGTRFYLSNIDNFEGYSMNALSGNITVTAIFSYQNSEHGNNDAKLVPVKQITNDGGSYWSEGTTDEVQSKITKTVKIIDNSKKIYTITFAFNKNDISDFTHFKFDGITADDLIGYYIK